MKWFLIFFVLFWIGFTFCIVQAIRFKNPYKLYMIFGKKGSGKTTFMTKLAVQAMRKGKIVYSTFYIPGSRLFDTKDIGRMTFPEGSVVFVDEVGMIWDNRKMNLTDWVRDWFKLQRQYKCTVWLASQAFDIDIKLRNLTDGMYMCHCKMGFLSIARKIKRDFTIVQPTAEGEARIADTLEFEPILLALFGFKTIIFTYIPRWTVFFKSFNPKPLPAMIYNDIPIPENLQKYFKKAPVAAGAPDDDIPE